MRAEKTNNSAYTSLSKSSSFSKTANIIDLIKRNREEEKREKVQKIYILLGSAGLILVLGMLIYL